MICDKICHKNLQMVTFIYGQNTGLDSYLAVSKGPVESHHPDAHDQITPQVI